MGDFTGTNRQTTGLDMTTTVAGIAGQLPVEAWYTFRNYAPQPSHHVRHHVLLIRLPRISSVGSVRCRHFKLVADAVDGVDVFRISAQFMQFLTQLLDVTVDSAVADDAVVRIDSVHQLVSTENLPGLVMQCLEQVELDSGQFTMCSAYGYHCLGLIESKLLSLVRPVVFRLTASENCLDTGDDFPGAEGFADIIISTDLQTEKTVYFLNTCSEHDDGQVAALA